MSKFRWFFMSKYRKLLYQIKAAEAEHQRFTLPNSVVLDFTYAGKVDLTNQEIAKLRKENERLKRVLRGLYAQLRRSKPEK